MPDPTEIDTEVGAELSIELESNPTTGYSWALDVPPDRLELLGREYARGSNRIGAGGRETFRLRAREVGEVVVIARYRRPWEEHAVEERRFLVRIRPASRRDPT